VPLNVALAKAIIDSRKKKKTIARLARLQPSYFSKIIHGDRQPTPIQRERIARVLERSEAELFTDAVSA
jgi:transcriptional regulator with XRE-family HTH domain